MRWSSCGARQKHRAVLEALQRHDGAGLDRLGVRRDGRDAGDPARPGGRRAGHRRRGDGLARSAGRPRVRRSTAADADRGSGAAWEVMAQRISESRRSAPADRITRTASGNPRSHSVRDRIPAARRHRLRQDRNLPARDRRDAEARAAGGRAGAGDRADAADDPPLRRPLSRARSPSGTASWATASGSTSGGACARTIRRRRWSSARARRCSCPSPIWG